MGSTRLDRDGRADTAWLQVSADAGVVVGLGAELVTSPVAQRVPEALVGRGHAVEALRYAGTPRAANRDSPARHPDRGGPGLVVVGLGVGNRAPELDQSCTASEELLLGGA